MITLIITKVNKIKKKSNSTLTDTDALKKRLLYGSLRKLYKKIKSKTNLTAYLYCYTNVP